MTIYDYVNTLDADYNNPGGGLTWTKNDVTQELINQANNLPYLQVTEHDVNVDRRFTTAIILRKLVDFYIYHEATPTTGNTPNHDLVQALWDQLFVLPDSVDEMTYGDQDFVRVEYVTGMSPQHDQRSGGVIASLRFRLYFARPRPDL